MGESGEDVQFSPAARKIWPLNIECKNKNKVAVYAWYDQAKSHGKHQPVLVIKQNQKQPLVVVDAEWFFKFYREHNGETRFTE
jgi:hypothetical protein